MDEKLKDLVLIGMGAVVIAAGALTNSAPAIYCTGGFLIGVGLYCYLANK